MRLLRFPLPLLKRLSLHHPTPRLPSLCAICHAWGDALLCAPCLHRFAPRRTRCSGCALVVPEGVARCIRCLREPPGVDGTVAAVDYGWPWSSLIARFKYRGATELGLPLAELLWRALPSAQPDLLVPVPTSSTRLRLRGFNQAALLAREVGALLKRPVHATALVATRERGWQHAASARSRRDNVRHAFAADPEHAAALAGCHVALIDDVMTTGATMSELARVLRQAGVRSVQAWVLARTPDPG